MRPMRQAFYSRFCAILFSLTLLGSVGIGCSSKVNPSFAVSSGEAREIIRQIEADPRPLDRPVVVMTGWADPIFVSCYWGGQLRKAAGDDAAVLSLSFVFKGSFERCRAHVIDSVQDAWPSDDPGWTTEVDVVAFSMGGLVARYGAAPRRLDPPPDGSADSAASSRRRLRIANLYTISTPHRGASMAWVPTFDRRVIDMRAGSDFLAYLDADLPQADYSLTAYTRLYDPIVGESRTAPPGINPRWVDPPLLHPSHTGAYRDPRIRADILRRLRGEPALTTTPAAPLPE